MDRRVEDYSSLEITLSFHDLPFGSGPRQKYKHLCSSDEFEVPFLKPRRKKKRKHILPQMEVIVARAP